MSFEEELEKMMLERANDLEPKTHCCECTKGSHYQKHSVHIQYKRCDCKPKDFVLKTNEFEKNQGVQEI